MAKWSALVKEQDVAPRAVLAFSNRFAEDVCDAFSGKEHRSSLASLAARLCTRGRGGSTAEARAATGTESDSARAAGERLPRFSSANFAQEELGPLIGTAVLAHSDATFGFPEIRRGALPGVVSVAARRRLSPAACEWLFCTGDAIDAATAQRLGLVDFVGSWEELDAEVARLERHFLSSAPRLRAPSPLPASEVTIEADADSRVALLEVTAASVGGLWRDALLVLDKLSPTLRVLVLSAEGQGGPSATLSLEACHRLDAAMSRLSEAGVVVLCYVRGQAAGLLLHACLGAHYRIVEAGAALSFDGESECNRAAASRLLQADDAKCLLQEGAVNSARALELGVASERVEGAGERALQFAHWLVQHSAVGVRHMLRLTCRPAADEAAQEARRSNEALLLEGLSSPPRALPAAKRE